MHCTGIISATQKEKLVNTIDANVSENIEVDNTVDINIQEINDYRNTSMDSIKMVVTMQFMFIQLIDKK